MERFEGGKGGCDIGGMEGGRVLRSFVFGQKYCEGERERKRWGVGLILL